ncbi:unnamed protein product [Mytilus edulis]|uniref:Uncharacterized protein n=1 Tax=Mytilus edulis TaxID=6550 RepID=A0A8S3RMQ5_MYTED|nr:unnamed protein product [Mytilus edulis]
MMTSRPQRNKEKLPGYVAVHFPIDDSSAVVPATKIIDPHIPFQKPFNKQVKINWEGKITDCYIIEISDNKASLEKAIKTYFNESDTEQENEPPTQYRPNQPSKKKESSSAKDFGYYLTTVIDKEKPKDKRPNLTTVSSVSTVKSQGQSKPKTKVLASTKIPASDSVKQPDGNQTQVNTIFSPAANIQPSLEHPKQPLTFQLSEKATDMVQKKIANLRDFSTQTDLSIPIDCDVLVVEDQIQEAVKSSPAPNHEASLQKNRLTNQPDLPSDIGFNISAFESFVANIDIQKGILQNRDILERIEKLLLNKNCIPMPDSQTTAPIKEKMPQQCSTPEHFTISTIEQEPESPPSSPLYIATPLPDLTPIRQVSEKTHHEESDYSPAATFVHVVNIPLEDIDEIRPPTPPHALQMPLQDITFQEINLLNNTGAGATLLDVLGQPPIPTIQPLHNNKHFITDTRFWSISISSVTSLKPAALTCQLHTLPITPEVNNSTTISEAILQDAKTKAGECRQRFATTLFRSIFNVSDTFERNVNGKGVQIKTQKEQINHTKMAILKLVTFQYYPCPTSDTGNKWNSVTRALDKANWSFNNYVKNNFNLQAIMHQRPLV